MIDDRSEMSTKSNCCHSHLISIVPFGVASPHEFITTVFKKSSAFLAKFVCRDLWLIQPRMVHRCVLALFKVSLTAWQIVCNDIVAGFGEAVIRSERLSTTDELQHRAADLFSILYGHSPRLWIEFMQSRHPFYCRITRARRS